MTSIASSATRARSSARRKKLRTPAKKSRTSSSAKAFSKDSIGTRCVTFENPAAGAAPTRRAGLSLLLGDPPVMRAAGGDLRRVRHDKHLQSRAEALQPFADRGGDGAADAAIDLVEDQRRHR